MKSAFTMIETLIVIVIITLLLTLTLPSLQQVRQVSGVTGEAHSLLNDNDLARINGVISKQTHTLNETAIRNNLMTPASYTYYRTYSDLDVAAAKRVWPYINDAIEITRTPPDNRVIWPDVQLTSRIVRFGLQQEAPDPNWPTPPALLSVSDLLIRAKYASTLDPLGELFSWKIATGNTRMEDERRLLYRYEVNPPDGLLFRFPR